VPRVFSYKRREEKRREEKRREEKRREEKRRGITRINELMESLAVLSATNIATKRIEGFQNWTGWTGCAKSFLI